MSFRAIAVCSIALCLLGSTPLAADCLGNDPQAAAKAFYRDHADFYYADPAKLQGVVTPRLLKLLTTNYACAEGAECALDSDPWVDAQDGDVAEPITYDLADHTANEVTVIMHYTFALSDTERKPQQVALKMHLSDQCWQVDDMIMPRGRSLADEIDTWFKINGADEATPPDTNTPQ